MGYVSRMKKGQKVIYYFATSNSKTATKVPFVENLIKKGYEILFMTDPLDEYVVMNLSNFRASDGTTEYTLVDVTRENLEAGNDMEIKEIQEEYEELCTFIKDVLKEKVEKVTISTRLDSSPCVLVTSKFGWSANMERIMKAQAGADARAYEYMRGRRSLEINPNNRVIKNLLGKIRIIKFMMLFYLCTRPHLLHQALI